MTPTLPEPTALPAPAQHDSTTADQASARQATTAVLEKLFELYPHLFGAKFLPLKLGIFQELLASHPEAFEREALKAALGTHTRSTAYLQCIAAGNLRHDLQGQPVEPVAPEHVYLTMLELFRRRQRRAREDLRPKFRAQLMTAFEASGLSRQDYQSRLPTNDAAATALLEEAFEERDQKLAKQEALLRTFENSGQTVDAFADMYGLDKRELMAAIKRKQPVDTASA
ncbi:MAG TPA: ProQ/FINO family protein [Polaromonas sp.]|uniref:ProQ/FINO family protein n=1 Tax=Polaromonas sp. TaxID=1869339 RepID=UPI002D49C527|nr:ProQ/FINO family protein [Polaromonas sp.]HYW58085.1 ProQ/FINO family protein [Polaromonas sp.]